MGEEGKLAVATARAHAEMARVWLDVARDPDTRVAILRGAGKGFSAGGDMAMVEEMTREAAVRTLFGEKGPDPLSGVDKPSPREAIVQELPVAIE